jgi:hypothetical protein
MTEPDEDVGSRRVREKGGAAAPEPEVGPAEPGERKTPANSGAQRKTVDVPPAETGRPSSRLPRDAADPELTESERQARVGSAGGGPYSPGAPGHDEPAE